MGLDSITEWIELLLDLIFAPNILINNINLPVPLEFLWKLDHSSLKKHSPLVTVIDLLLLVFASKLNCHSTLFTIQKITAPPSLQHTTRVLVFGALRN